MQLGWDETQIRFASIGIFQFHDFFQKAKAFGKVYLPCEKKYSFHNKKETTVEGEMTSQRMF